MGITVLKHNAPWGPFSPAQIEEGLRRGDFTLNYLAHAPGLKEWLPLGEVLHFMEPGPALPPVPVARELPALPAATSPPPPPAKVQSPPPLPPIPPRVPAGEAKTVGTNETDGSMAAAPEPGSPGKTAAPLQTASFFRRGMAFAIDCTILFVPVLALFGIGAATVQLQGWSEHANPEVMREEWILLNRNFHELLLIVATGLGWLYAAGMEASPAQATVGKKWMGIRVTDADGQRLGFLRATGRYAAKYLSALPCLLGFLMALVDSRGLALHDRLARTRVAIK